MKRQYWVWAIAPVAIVTLLCADTQAQHSSHVGVRYEGPHVTAGYHYQNPAQYHHVGRAYQGSDYVGRPGVYYRQGHTNTNYYRTYGYGTHAGYSSGYGNGYGTSTYTRPTWYEGLTRRDLTTGQTTTWSPLQYNTAGYYVGNYASGSYTQGAAGYSSGYGCGYANCGGCNVCGSYVQPQPQPTLQWRTMSTDKAQRDAYYRNQQPAADPCEPCEPCRKGVIHEHPHKHKRDADTDRGGIRESKPDAKRDDQRRRRMQQERQREHHDRDDRDDRKHRHHRRHDESRGESRQPIERKQIEIGYPSGGNEWMEPGPQLISSEQPRGEVNLQRREIVDSADGWQMMREGDVEAAREWFSQRVMNESKVASLQIGYALSSAATGKMATGVWAMRQALRLDRSVLDHIRMDQQLSGQVRDLIGRYRYAPSDLISDSDGAYMAASLHYLLGEFDYAAVAIDHAINNGGDDDRSVLQLRDVIEGARQRR